MKMTTQENIALVKSAYEAVGRNDLNAFRQTLAPNIEWVEENAPGLWFQGTHRGANSALKEVVEPAFSKITDFKVEMTQFFGVGEHVIAVGRFRGRGKATGKELNSDTAHVLTCRDGKIVRFQAFQDIAAWRDALGLSQWEAERLAA